MKLTNITYYDDESLMELLEWIREVLESPEFTERYKDIFSMADDYQEFSYSNLKVMVSYYEGEDGCFAKSKKPYWKRRHGERGLHIGMKRRGKMYKSELEQLASAKTGVLPFEASLAFSQAVIDSLFSNLPLYNPHEMRASNIVSLPAPCPNNSIPLIKVHPRAKVGSKVKWQALSTFMEYTKRKANYYGLAQEFKLAKERLSACGDLVAASEARWDSVVSGVSKQNKLGLKEAHDKMIEWAKEAGLDGA